MASRKGVLTHRNQEHTERERDRGGWIDDDDDNNDDDHYDAIDDASEATLRTTTTLHGQSYKNRRTIKQK